MALQVPKDVWGIIAQELNIQELLSLRATCTRINAIVISMQARWFRAHQWYLSKKNESKVKCAVRVHYTLLSRHCVPNGYDYPGKKLTDNYYQREAAYQKMIDDGIFQESNCTQRHHWAIRVPKNEQDIPLDSNFKPKRCNYIYYYLIECYRNKKPSHSERKNTLTRHLSTCKRDIQDCEARIKLRKEQIVRDEAELKRISAQYQDNNIFDGYALNSYKTPAGTSKKRKIAACTTKK